ncbi:MAG: serine protein kinase [Desulfobacteraceae bacterium 4572_19]|nr:MAG: serine protein kinase [Desulfobacteraceae bacterium 4572_19]
MEKNINKAMEYLNHSISDKDHYEPISFEQYLEKVTNNPSKVIRNIFQIYYDMIKKYVGEGVDEYPDDPETIHFVDYDCDTLLAKDTAHPFFADRLFANRLVNQVKAMRRGTQQNKIYIFEGPHGCGKSTFLNNLLQKFEEYANTEDGMQYEAVWRLDLKVFGEIRAENDTQLVKKLITMLSKGDSKQSSIGEESFSAKKWGEFIEVSCVSHDNPLLMVPKEYRRSFLDELIVNDEFKWKLFTEKEYEWVFNQNACTICTSLFKALFTRLRDVSKVFKMIYVRPYVFNRRIGEGISVFNPGDHPIKNSVLTNSIIQKRIDSIFKDSNQVRYIYSMYAKTNNGIYSLMDIKSHNTERLAELHNIISEGVHKVDEIEEDVSSLFFALMNPEDKINIKNISSFSDRIEYINIPYVLDLKTEVEIYRNIFGKHITDAFLPRVLHNFARVIISTRLKLKSDAMTEWIKQSEKYSLYCDKNLLLLKMEIYTGVIPEWLMEEDRKQLNAVRRRNIIRESETEGKLGFSGRDSIKIFNDFYSAYHSKDNLINMSMLHSFFTKLHRTISGTIPSGFLKSLVGMYDYSILQEVKESLYYYNEEQIDHDIKNYLFALNFEIGSEEKCVYTEEKLEITEEFLTLIEDRLIEPNTTRVKRLYFRTATQSEYTSSTLSREILVEGKSIEETKLYKEIYERYVHNLKAKVLDPFLDNENFRRAIKDYDSKNFKSYGKRIRSDVTFLINNLIERCGYTKMGARQVCIYAIDNNLVSKFG